MRSNQITTTAMNLNEFRIGERFLCDKKVWLCTDVGTRVVIATCLTVCRTNDWARALSHRLQNKAWKFEPAEVLPAWLKGPPFRELGEDVFDELKQKDCEPWDSEQAAVKEG